MEVEKAEDSVEEEMQPFVPDAESDSDQEERRLPIKKSKTRLKSILSIVGVAIASLVILAVVFVCGFLLGRTLYSETSAGATSRRTWGSTVGMSQPVSDWLSNKLNPDSIRENSRQFTQITSKPHIAGKEQNSRVANLIHQAYLQSNFDRVEMTNYSVLLSYVNRTKPNVVQIRNKVNNDIVYGANTEQEPPLTQGENDPNVPPPFNAFSSPGQVTGLLVYVNYGTIDDFNYVKFNLSLDFTGRICIVRYGHIFRGNKAQLAQRYGCIGLIIYSDPADYDQDHRPTYPKGPYLPSGGVQRGTVMVTNGDPLTPGLPAIDNVYRRTYKDSVNSGTTPSIPVQPISYGDAIYFMSLLDLYKAPNGWTGQLSINYHIYQSANSENVTYLEVNNIFERRTIANVFGIIYGNVEPDRLVLLGNHYDAWTFGGVDPNSGTAVILDVARVLGDLLDKGWRPGRTLVLCSWDAEEYGLIGSTEWVEDFKKLLAANGVAYLNVDEAVSGTLFFLASASPLLHEVIYNVTQKVSCPCSGYPTVYEQWKSRYQSTRPEITNLGSGSDFTSFIQTAGVTSSSFTYATDSYAVYHSVHDNFYWMTNFGDPDFSHHAAMGEVWLKVAMAIATTPIIPYNPTDYSDKLKALYNELLKDYGDQLKKNNVSTDFLLECIGQFEAAANGLQMDLVKYANTKNSNIIRILNNKLLNIERAFIISEGLPGQVYNKHVIFAPSTTNAYSSSSFPGVVDALYNATTIEDWNSVSRQLDIVAIHIRYATQIMNQPSLEWISE